MKSCLTLSNSLLIVIESDLINLCKEYYCVVHVFISTILRRMFLLFLINKIGNDSCIEFTNIASFLGEHAAFL